MSLAFIVYSVYCVEKIFSLILINYHYMDIEMGFNVFSINSVEYLIFVKLIHILENPMNRYCITIN